MTNFKITTQPAPNFHFRYIKELGGTSHGHLTGYRTVEQKNNNLTNYPTVQFQPPGENINGKVFYILCSIHNFDNKRLSPHQLLKKSETAANYNFVFEEMTEKSGIYSWELRDYIIARTVKEKYLESMNGKEIAFGSLNLSIPFGTLKGDFNSNNAKSLKESANLIVCLGFTIFEQIKSHNGYNYKLCENTIYSDRIYNGDDLNIHKICNKKGKKNEYTEVTLLIRFDSNYPINVIMNRKYETTQDITWTSGAIRIQNSPGEMFCNSAITFMAPPYNGPCTSTEDEIAVQVAVQVGNSLYKSNVVKFIYINDDNEKNEEPLRKSPRKATVNKMMKENRSNQEEQLKNVVETNTRLNRNREPLQIQSVVVIPARNSNVYQMDPQNRALNASDGAEGNDGQLHQQSACQQYHNMNEVSQTLNESNQLNQTDNFQAGLPHDFEINQNQNVTEFDERAETEGNEMVFEFALSPARNETAIYELLDNLLSNCSADSTDQDISNDGPDMAADKNVTELQIKKTSEKYIESEIKNKKYYINHQQFIKIMEIDKRDWNIIFYQALLDIATFKRFYKQNNGNEALLKVVINARNDNRESLLHYACKHAKTFSIRPLIGLGWRLSDQDNCGRTALHIALEKCNEECILEIQKILENPSKYTKFLDNFKQMFKVYNNEGYTVLHAAIAENKLELVKIMLEFCQKYNIDVLNYEVLGNGNSIVHLVAEQNLMDMAAIIRKYVPGYLTVKNYYQETIMEMSEISDEIKEKFAA